MCRQENVYAGIQYLKGLMQPTLGNKLKNQQKLSETNAYNVIDD